MNRSISSRAAPTQVGANLQPREQLPRGIYENSAVCGIYFLFLRQRVVYVGQSVNIHARVSTHRYEGKDFDFYTIMEVDKSALDFVEKAMIRTLQPETNKMHKGIEEAFDDVEVRAKEKMLLRLNGQISALRDAQSRLGKEHSDLLQRVEVTRDFRNLTSLPEIQRKRIVGTREAADFIGFSVPHFRRLYRTGKFPKGIQIGERKLGWRVGDLADWLDGKRAVS